MKLLVFFQRNNLEGTPQVAGYLPCRAAVQDDGQDMGDIQVSHDPEVDALGSARDATEHVHPLLHL